MDDRQTEHVGAYIRRLVIPPDMSVTDAAKTLGVGRPALSKLLNGRASLSSEMALRLEKTFGADRQDLLERQVTSHRPRSIDADRAVAAGRFVPPFLSIKARQVEAWAKNSEARDRLSVLLRTLVHSTGDGLSRVDFPGHDDAQRPGWDGWVESESATPWIPQGKSGWEFGVSQDASSKAACDYAKRLSIARKERAQCTFVFVTPCRWWDKDKWAKAMSATAEWKAVRAYDASDLEQWLEQSIAGQIWLADQLQIRRRGCQTLDRFWENWRSAAEPRITEKIFAATVEAHRTCFKQWLAEPRDRPLYVAADSTGEAVAFLACLFRHPDVPTQERDRAVLFESADTLKALALATSPFIPIVCDQETERELVPLQGRVPCIAVRPRNAVDRASDIVLELLGQEAFRRVLVDMDIERDAVRLARESGRSPTILRRRLAKSDAISLPQWASDRDTARSLLPLTLAGAWHATSNADCKVLSDLTDGTYNAVEENITHLRQLNDPPVWSVGQYRGVASQIDALFAVSPHLTEKDVDLFLESAKSVLSERDPALKLPEDQRWAAAMHGKARDHSEALRKGICETLALLAIHGNSRVQQRLGVDVAARISSLITELLTPLTLDKLLSHDRDLPLYAEAAPEQFLNVLEHDLREAVPVLQGLLRPATPGRWWEAPRRTGLLWALECLAWSPQHLPRVSRILAQLAGTRIDDNWGPKPISSLEAIFHSWTPQTAAPLDDRIRCLKMLTGKFPAVGWQICNTQLERHAIDVSSHRPRWRDCATGVSEVSEDEELAFIRSVLDLAMAWPEHDENTLGDLIEHLDGMSEQDRGRVWSLVDTWAETTADDKAKADLSERISRFVYSLRNSPGGLTVAIQEAARAARKRLLTSDPAIRHGWLFAKPWVAGFDDETDETGDDHDWRKRDERVRELRSKAMAEIWASHRWEGVVRLLDEGDAAEVVGRFAGPQVPNRSNAVEILRTCLCSDAVSGEKLDGFMRGFIASLDAAERPDILRAAGATATVDQAARLFRCAPLGSATWRLLDQQMREVRNVYWSAMSPSRWNWLTEAELAECIDSLLQVKRPRAAFHAMGRNAQSVETSCLKRLLSDLATVHDEAAGSFPVDRHDLSDALDALDGRAGVTREEMALLEYSFLETTEGRKDKTHGIPNLELVVASNPAFFAHAVSLVYKRSDDRQDPPGLHSDDPDRRRVAARKAYALLSRLNCIPGSTADGTVDKTALRAWCTEVRRLCGDHGRLEVGDVHIGELLARGVLDAQGHLAHDPSEQDGVWPWGPVCDVMESIASVHVGRGFHVAVRNARGAHFRGLEDGGDQERQIADTYRVWSRRLSFEYPYVSRVLGRIADSYEREGAWNDSQAGVRRRLFD